jgi:hypothetical protein
LKQAHAQWGLLCDVSVLWLRQPETCEAAMLIGERYDEAVFSYDRRSFCHSCEYPFWKNS